MKQQKLTDYQPKYPKKALKGVTLAAAALIAMGTAAGCRFVEVQTSGIVPMEEPGVEETIPPEELQTEGYVAYEPTPEPEELMLSGDVAILEPPGGE
ncbi:MAG: hypothetical protein II412_06750 [Clostridia bacterium]|nr:hypothetical protein [Clostridia bacterium]